jgi:hypothetical protein
MTRPTKHRDICGTVEGHRAHVKSKEARCQACADVWSIVSGPTTDELAAEIEWLLKLNQGSHYILNAIGYTGREKKLRDRLHKRGYGELAYRLLRMEDQAAA